MAGRITLVNSVLASVPNFNMQFFLPLSKLEHFISNTMLSSLELLATPEYMFKEFEEDNLLATSPREWQYAGADFLLEQILSLYNLTESEARKIQRGIFLHAISSSLVPRHPILSTYGNNLAALMASVGKRKFPPMKGQFLKEVLKQHLDPKVSFDAARSNELQFIPECLDIRILWRVLMGTRFKQTFSKSLPLSKILEDKDFKGRKAFVTVQFAGRLAGS